MNAKDIVGALLEDDGHSEHMKGWDRIRKWDGAHSTFQHLMGLERKKHKIQNELGQGIAIERALAHYGVERGDVTEWITGDRVGLTHNYKREVPAMPKRRDEVLAQRHSSKESQPGRL